LTLSKLLVDRELVPTDTSFSNAASIPFLYYIPSVSNSGITSSFLTLRSRSRTDCPRPAGRDGSRSALRADSFLLLQEPNREAMVREAGRQGASLLGGRSMLRDHVRHSGNVFFRVHPPSPVFGLRRGY
jgi:hypothetical protein